MGDVFEQVRHRPQAGLDRPREIIVACAPTRSQVNLATIIRTAGCCGVAKVIVCGNGRIDPKIARDSIEHVDVERHRTLGSSLKALAKAGYCLVGLEQTTNSVSLHEYKFARRTVLVIGNERLGIAQEDLSIMDACVEIPVWGHPHSYNVGTAAAMAMYEYCKQYPRG